MRSKSWIFIGLCSITFFNQCKMQKKFMVDPISTTQAVVKISKSPCFGSCPVYEMQIFDDRSVIFHGKKYTDKLGLYEKELDQELYELILSSFKEYDFLALEDEYPSPVMDAPSTTISFRDGAIMKQVKTKANGPPSFAKVAKMLEDLADSEGWNNLATAVVEEDPTLPDQIIFQLKSDVDIDLWQKQFDQYQFRVIKRLSPKMNYWLATYNDDLIEKEKMLRTLILHDDVINAEFNKKVTIR